MKYWFRKTRAALAYPIDENIAGGILNVSTEVFGWMMVHIDGKKRPMRVLLFCLLMFATSR